MASHDDGEELHWICPLGLVITMTLAIGFAKNQACFPRCCAEA